MRTVQDNGPEKEEQAKLTQNEVKHLRKRGVWTLTGIGAIGTVMLAIGLVGHSSAVKNMNNILSYQNQANTEVENKIAVKKAANQRKVKNAGQAITGLDYVRQNKDDKVMNQFLSRILTWDNADEYRANRRWAFKKYSIDPNSSFAKTMLPDVAQTNIGVGDKGNNTIDINSLNMKFLDMKSYVTDIRGSDYTYFTVIRVQSHDKKGAVATGNIAMIYTMDGHGKFYNLKAYNSGDY